MANGALGGKLLGAGAGGFLMFVAPDNVHKKITSALGDIRTLPIQFDVTGTEIIYNSEYQG